MQLLAVKEHKTQTMNSQLTRENLGSHLLSQKKSVKNLDLEQNFRT